MKNKIIIAALAIAFALCALTGCGDVGRNASGEAQTTKAVKVPETTEAETPLPEKESEKNEEPEYIDGFEKAEYDKFNSYASENGLDGTLIYIEGKVLNQTKIESENDEPAQLAIVVADNDGNRWGVGIVSESKITEIEGKNVRIFGTYLGFSDVMNVPSMVVAVDDEKIVNKARIEVKDNDEYKVVYNFYDDYIKEQLENSETEKQTEPKENEKPEENSLTVGSTFEAEDLKITINSADLNFTNYSDDYGFYKPANGMKYIMASFTFENIGNSSAYVSIYDFDCYADNTVCEQAYLPDDSDFMSTNLSAGRNVAFQTYYQVPIDAKSIELEYEIDMWTGEKAIIILQ